MTFYDYNLGYLCLIGNSLDKTELRDYEKFSSKNQRQSLTYSRSAPRRRRNRSLSNNWKIVLVFQLIALFRGKMILCVSSAN